MEFEVLWALASEAGRVLSRQALMLRLRGISNSDQRSNIDAWVSRLRRKLEADWHASSRIKTIRGEGYLFVPEIEGGWSPGRQAGLSDALVPLGIAGLAHPRQLHVQARHRRFQPGLVQPAAQPQIEGALHFPLPQRRGLEAEAQHGLPLSKLSTPCSSMGDQMKG